MHGSSRSSGAKVGVKGAGGSTKPGTARSKGRGSRAPWRRLNLARRFVSTSRSRATSSVAYCTTAAAALP